jgi:hypothetical protein
MQSHDIAMHSFSNPRLGPTSTITTLAFTAFAVSITNRRNPPKMGSFIVSNPSRVGIIFSNRPKAGLPGMSQTAPPDLSASRTLRSDTDVSCLHKGLTCSQTLSKETDTVRQG